jgi:3-isopropylmalate dehydrogenase
MMLRYSFSFEKAAAAIDGAITAVLERGHRTADLAVSGQLSIGTVEMTDHLIQEINQQRTPNLAE